MEVKQLVKDSSKVFWQKWSVAFKIVPVLIIVVVLKLLSHYLGFEILEQNALFTSLVAGTIFLIGFLISGVLSDYKESEKMPSELSVVFKSMYDDAYSIFKLKESAKALDFIEYQKSLLDLVFDWLYKRVETEVLLEEILKINDYLVQFEKEGVAANYIIKLKNEQVALRKMILRIDTIRDTNFIGSAYAIVEAMGAVIAFGLIIIKITPFFAALFFTILVMFLISYMFYLIKDLDNPFDYSANGESGTEISLKPLYDHKKALEKVGL